MEISDSDAADLCKLKYGDSQSSIRSAIAPGDPDLEQLIARENLPNNLGTNAQNDDTAIYSDKEANTNKSHIGSNTKCKEKELLETEMPKSIFHLSANMKKDLSMLTFPSKTHARKKAVISSRITPNSRITIAEALEKAEDARKSMSSLHKPSNKVDNLEGNISNLPSQYHATDKIVDTDKEYQDVAMCVALSDTSGQVKEKLKLDSEVPGKGVADGTPPSDAAEELAPYSEGKTESVGGKAKSSGTSRVQMTRRMWEVLKFTFDHEHFPSSVHMARLAKMMGLPWSQVRNWFTDRRVENKKAGIYPRDKPLLHCPHCAVTLDLEADQKNHLFSTQHVRNILREEYCGGGTPESIKWKKLPQTVNAVSKMSGARILAVGFSAEDSKKKDSKNLPEKKVEPVVEGVSHSKELKKLWTEAMLLPEEKEPPLGEWNSVRFNQENNSDNKCESFKYEGRDKTHLNLRTQEEKEKVLKPKNLENLCASKPVVSSRVGSISAMVGDTMPCSTSDNALATAKKSISLTSDVMVNSVNYSHPVNASNTSEGMFRHPSTKKSQTCQDTSTTSEVETNFGKKLSMGSMMMESPMESQRLSTVSMEVPQKAFKLTFPNSKKPKNKQTNFSPIQNNISQDKLTKSSTFASQLMQDPELKQEHESDDSWHHMNNITMYRADGIDASGKSEFAVINANQASLAINQSSGTYRPCSPRRSQFLQKSTSVKYQPKIGKLGTKQAVTKVSRTIDKRKLKLRTHQIGPTSKDTKAKVSVCEGNLIVGYQCPKCSKIFQTEWLMMKHSVTHFKYHCDICYQVYPDENMMKIHLLDHLSGAYEDEKYYCQFSCKVCHSLKCGCFEPTYCKPKDLPKIFFRPQKAKRSKRGFISKLNTGPNDHLKISMSAYKKLIVSGDVVPSKEVTVTSTSSKPMHAEDTLKLSLLKDAPRSASVGDSQKPNFFLKEAKISNTIAEAQKLLHSRRDQEFPSIKLETNGTSSPKQTGLGASTGMQLEVRPNNNGLEKKVAKEKQLNWNEVRTKFAFDSKSHANSQSLSISKSTETGDEKTAKRVVGRKRTTKFSKNTTYEDTVFFYMCDICDASFSTKSELSEHVFLHRLKSRSRRGEKRNISSDLNDKEFSKKSKVCNVDHASTETVAESSDNHICELCHVTFTTAADYRAHKILAHKEPKSDNGPQSIEVYRCKYCEKIYRRRRELKRHLKRDCTVAPASVRGMLSGPSYSRNVIEDAHYTTLKIDFDDTSDAPSKSAGKCVKGPIVCKYCLAVTKREAEMKRHIWKFCLKVPSEVVKKFMDGASLEELGFKYMKDDKVSAENLNMEVSNNKSVEIPETLNSLHESSSTLHSGFDPKMTSPVNTKITPVQEDTFEEMNSAKQSFSHLDFIKSQNPKKTSPANKKISVEANMSKKFNSAKQSFSQSGVSKSPSPKKSRANTEVPPVQANIFEEFNSSKPSLEEKMETPAIRPEPSGDHNISMIQLEDSKETYAHPEANAKKRLIKILPKKEDMQSTFIVGETGQSSTSTSLPASPVMQFPVVLPVMATSAKSKRPLVCGYCGIWYFREMAILKHMKERCIKIPELEKELLKNNSLLCNVPQRGAIASENGAVYKMVKVPEHLQNTPVPMPKDISNEDIKELNANINAFNENTSAKATVTKEQNSLGSASVEVNEGDSLSSSSAEVKEQDVLSESFKEVKEQGSVSSCTEVKEQDDLSSTSTIVMSSLTKGKEQSLSSSPTKGKEQGNLSSSSREVKEASLSSSMEVKQDRLSSSSTEVKKQDSSSSSPSKVIKQNSPSSSPSKVKKQSSPTSSVKVKKQDGPSTSPSKVKRQNSPSSSPSKVKKQDNPSSSLAKVKKRVSPSSSPSKVKKQDSPFSSPAKVKKQGSPLSSPAKVKKQGSPLSSPAKVKGQNNISSLSATKEQDKLSSSPSVIKEHDCLSSSPPVVQEKDCPSSLFTTVKEQDSLSSPTAVNEDSLSSSPTSSPLKLNTSTPSKRGSRCRRCHEHFKSQEAVLAHSSVHHGPKKGFYKCKLCHARLAKYKQLREHVWEHTDENPYRCHLCQAKYRSSDSFVEHLNTIHQYTSIHDKNLYKWLPGRHGRYRDIKTKNSSCEEKVDDVETREKDITTKNSSCEEKLDDVDTNLDSLAEVMVITDKDICSKTVDSQSKANNNKSPKSFEMNEQSVDSKNVQEGNKSLSTLDDSLENNTLQNKKMSCNSRIESSTDSNVCSNEGGKAVNVNKVDNSSMEDQDTLKNRLETMPCDSQSVKTAVVPGENKDVERTQTNDRTKSKSVSHVKKHVSGEIKSEEKVSPQCRLEEDFTGEGVLPLLENLESVVETVHLTDKHLS